MLRFQKTVEAKEGHLGELLEVAKEATALMNQIMPEIKLLVFADALGKLPLVQWQLDCEDMAQYEVARDQWASNESFVSFAQKIPTLIVEGSGRDMLWRGV